MSDYYTKTPIRVPVRLVNGQWEFFYGGLVPAREGATGDLIVQKESITDPNFLKLVRKRTEHRLLDEGTELMVALSARSRSGLMAPFQELLTDIPPSELSGEYYWTPRPAETLFVMIKVGPPSDAFARRRPGQLGGVWLQLAGTQPKGIVVSSVTLPDGVDPGKCDSINHAFTRLSEVFEPWRVSHTGNIYSRVLYRETNGKWYPLDRLRRAAEATEEHALIKQRWEELLTLFTR